MRCLGLPCTHPRGDPDCTNLRKSSHPCFFFFFFISSCRASRQTHWPYSAFMIACLLSVSCIGIHSASALSLGYCSISVSTITGLVGSLLRLQFVDTNCVGSLLLLSFRRCQSRRPALAPVVSSMPIASTCSYAGCFIDANCVDLLLRRLFHRCQLRRLVLAPVVSSM